MITMLQNAVVSLALLALAQVHAAEVVIPSDISVHLSAQPNVNLTPGEPIVFTLTIVNHGPEIVNDLGLISSNFYDQIDLNYGSVDCQGVVLDVADGETFHFNYSWYPTIFNGPFAVGESRTCHITLTLTGQAPPIWPFGFNLRAYFEDINPTNNVSTVILRRGDIAPVAIPTLSLSALLLLAMGLTVAACCAFRQRRNRVRGAPWHEPQDVERLERGGHADRA